ncbi:MaoC family dehydratase N-terminal domain-containing protein [Rhodococcus pseudokoreensis]|uniref:MaoC family dehydratase N-terminal domain-containing protein n=1 Tax=Rhodococcus pseudokoreensis TaxID=2811421 RepID=A0A974W8B6_9NOCA|nr:MaoC/PaaZ C-terminal domain-containing protein [Rhodococcus pseudokoreensis]QSE92989.1 MaoC family dehydratase N-terminal domain-containing protein [Rhodococcus pseudokoreensis]
MGNATKPAFYFEDFDIGDTFTTPSRTVGLAEVATFAGLSGDYNPIHTDAEFASKSQFGERIAHGVLGMSVLTGLVTRLGVFEAGTIALLGIEEWRFKGPVFDGDTIHVKVLIEDKKLTSDGKRGVLRRRYQLVNQREEVVQEGVMPLLMKCRPE